MWNKLLLPVLFLISGINIAFSQEFLGRTHTEIKRFLEDNRANVLHCIKTVDTLRLVYSEEDERNRRFEVEYSFFFTKDTCRQYEKKVPSHEYYANQIKDNVSLKNAEGSGNMLEIDGETLYSVYRFEKYVLLLQLENNKLILSYQFL